MQQTTKYILDNAKKAMKKEKIISPLLKFLEQVNYFFNNVQPYDKSALKIKIEEITCPFKFRKFLEAKIQVKLTEMSKKMINLSKANKGDYDIWNSVQSYLGNFFILTIKLGQ